MDELDHGFEIEANGMPFFVIPLEDGTFDIYGDDKLAGNIYADNRIDTELIWSTSDLIPERLVQLIGEAIERHEK